MQSPALPEPPYGGRGEPPSSSSSADRRPSTSPSRAYSNSSSASAYYAVQSTPQVYHANGVGGDGHDGQEYLGGPGGRASSRQGSYSTSNNLNHSRQASYDELASSGPATPLHGQAQYEPPYGSSYQQPQPAQLSQANSSNSLSQQNSTPYQAESPRQPMAGQSPKPSSSSMHGGDEDRLGEGLGLGRIAEQQATPQPRKGSGWGVQDEGVPTTFDEEVLRNLCDSDFGMPLLLDRLKQSMASSREASAFFKKRAMIEEEYARAMIKLARSSTESYAMSEGKAGSFNHSWLQLLKTHESLGDNRLKLSAQLNEMSEELVVLAREVDKSRKSSKELGARLEKGLLEQENLVDKARGRFEAAAEELERLLMLKQGESARDVQNTPHSASQQGPQGASQNKRSFGKTMAKLKGPKNPAQVAKQEEEVRSRMGQSTDAYRSQVQGALAARQEYFNQQLPRLLRTLKEHVDEVDLGTHYHLSRYGYVFEATLVADGLTIAPTGPDDPAGVKQTIDGMDIKEDFRQYMAQYKVSWHASGQRGPRRDGPSEDGYLPTNSRPTLSPRASQLAVSQAFQGPPAAPTFGVDLGEQMLRDGVEVPRILEKCCEAIELHGLESMGIYRLSGTTSRVQRLKQKLDRDLDGTDLLSEENLADINDTAAVMKLWFREMPEPLLTWDLYHGFIDAAKIENDRLRHIRLHERVNDLPDPNYATLRYLMGHLHQVRQREGVNQMGCSNLAIVFGPNLLGAPPSQGGNALADMQWQCKCIETILQHYEEIFVDTE